MSEPIRGRPCLRSSGKVSFEELTKTIKAANRGDQKACSRFREILRGELHGETDHGLLTSYGNPPFWLREAWLENLAGESQGAREAITTRMIQVQRDLEGPNPSALEKLLAERAALCWLAVNQAELFYASAKDLSIRQGEYHIRKVDAANRRFLAACKTLAAIRKLALQVNIGANQVNVAGS
jgi:hypothetical protein